MTRVVSFRRCFTKRHSPVYVASLATLLLLVSALSFLTTLYYKPQDNVGQGNPSTTNKCSAAIEDLCRDYGQRLVSGNMCREICHAAAAQFFCLRPPGEGKTVIILSRQSGERLVVKAATLSKNREPLSEYLKTIKDYDGGLKQLKTISEHTLFSEAAFERFLTHIEFERSSRELFPRLWTGDALLAQEEYVRLNELQEDSLVSKLHGACGRYYVVEYAGLVDTLNVNSLWAGLPWTAVGKWKERAAVSRQLVDLAEQLDVRDMSFCDVKGENFGRRADGRLVLIDVDTLFTNAELRRSLLETGRCVSDTDCNWWDCHGRCDRYRHRCAGVISNTNLHAMCVKLFLSNGSNGFHGLLTRVPADHRAITTAMGKWCYGYTITEDGDRELLATLKNQLAASAG